MPNLVPKIPATTWVETARDVLVDEGIDAVKVDRIALRLGVSRGGLGGGAHGWRFDYRFHGKRNTLSLGTYPDTSLGLARRKADEARGLLAEGKNPSDLRKAEKASWAQAEIVEERKAKGLPPLDSFEAVAREWFDIKKSGWAPMYAEKIIGRLVADVFPYVGHEPVAQITPVRLLEVLRRIEKRGVIETAHRALENCSQVFRYAAATGRMTANPARDLKDALRRPEPKHMAAITDPKRFGELLRACDAYAATPVVRAALKLAPMLMLRPGELRFAEWAEFDLDAALWTVPSARMKREVQQKLHGAPHLVPLPKQAVAALRELHPLTGRGKLVFRGERHHDRPMSDNTINAGLRAMGFSADEVTTHGFRATARTMLHERLGFSPDVIEAQLAHSVRDNLGRAYNRTEFIEQRRAMLQRWADFLDELRLSADTVKPVDESSVERVNAEKLLTPQAAADLVHVSRYIVVRHIDSGDIPVIMVGTRQRVRKQDVLAWHERVQDKSATARDKLLKSVDDQLPA